MQKCEFKKDWECNYPIPIKCEDKCPYGELLAEFESLKQTYDACYKEHLRVLEQNRKMQKSLNILIDRGLADGC